MASKNLELYSVAGSRIHEEIIHTEQELQSAWWTRYRDRTDKKFAATIGAVPPKEPFAMPEMPKQTLGEAAARQLKDSDLWMQSSTQADFFFSQSSPLWDYLIKNDALNHKPYHKRGMPSYYGRRWGLPHARPLPSTHGLGHHPRDSAPFSANSWPAPLPHNPDPPPPPLNTHPRSPPARSLHSSSSDGTDHSTRAH